MATSPVKLKCYDLSRGIAATIAGPLLGMAVEGVWHTSILCHGLEWFYGGGIQCGAPDVVEHDYNMTPLKVLELGVTNKTLDEIRAWCNKKNDEFSEENYDFLHHNCNTFTHELSLFLAEGQVQPGGIPKDILFQHEMISNQPGGKMIVNMIDSFQKQAKAVQAQGGPAGFLATGRPVGQQAPIPAWTSDPDNFEILIKQVWEDLGVPVDVKKESFRRLYLLANNVVRNATDPKFRTIKAHNDKIRQTVLALPTGHQILETLGFHYTNAGGEEVYTLGNNVNREVLQHLTRASKLLAPVDQATQHQATSAAPSTANKFMTEKVAPLVGKGIASLMKNLGGQSQNAPPLNAATPHGGSPKRTPPQSVTPPSSQQYTPHHP